MLSESKKSGNKIANMEFTLKVIGRKYCICQNENFISSGRELYAYVTISIYEMDSLYIVKLDFLLRIQRKFFCY